MTAVDMRCDLCGSPDFVGVAAVPGFPVSLAWCKWCLGYQAMPLFTAEVTLCDEDVIMPDGCLRATISRHGLERVTEIAAPWFLGAMFWIPPEGEIGKVEGPGRYMKLEDYLAKLASDL